jgi:hypothetical protein
MIHELDLSQLPFGAISGYVRWLLGSGHNIELAAAIIVEQSNTMILLQSGARPIVRMAGIDYALRYKTAKGFDLAPSKMKGVGRRRVEGEAEDFARRNNFMLIEYVPSSSTLRYRFVRGPRVVRIKTIGEAVI